MTGEFANLYINVQTLGEKVNVKLIINLNAQGRKFIKRKKSGCFAKVQIIGIKRTC